MSRTFDNRKFESLCGVLSSILQWRRTGLIALSFISLCIIYSLRDSFTSSSVYLPDLSTVGAGVGVGDSSDAAAVSTQSPKKVAVIIEERPLNNLAPLILHFSSVLGPSWPIIFFTTQPMPESSPFRRAVKEKRITIHGLPTGTNFKDHQKVSEFLTTPWFWEQLAPADHVLIFQADSILCSNSVARVDDFLMWDLIGAPINPQYGAGYNGGLSIRNRLMTLDIVKKNSWKDELETNKDAPELPNEPHGRFEDQWFYQKMRDYPGAKLPSHDEAGKFSVETLWYEKPLGYHQAQTLQKENLTKIETWCPEVRMATSEILAFDPEGST